MPTTQDDLPIIGPNDEPPGKWVTCPSCDPAYDGRCWEGEYAWAVERGSALVKFYMGTAMEVSGASGSDGGIVPPITKIPGAEVWRHFGDRGFVHGELTFLPTAVVFNRIQVPLRVNRYGSADRPDLRDDLQNDDEFKESVQDYAFACSVIQLMSGSTFIRHGSSDGGLNTDTTKTLSISSFG